MEGNRACRWILLVCLPPLIVLAAWSGWAEPVVADKPSFDEATMKPWREKVGLLIEAARGKKEASSMELVRQLTEGGGPAVRAVVEALKDEEKVKAAGSPLMEVLWTNQNAAGREALCELLLEGVPRIRPGIAMNLSGSSWMGPEINPVLRKALGDENGEVRVWVAQGLNRRGDNSGYEVALAEADSADTQQGYRALTVLEGFPADEKMAELVVRKMGTAKGSQLWEALKLAGKCRDDRVRQALTEYIGKDGQYREQAIPSLVAVAGGECTDFLLGRMEQGKDARITGNVLKDMEDRKVCERMIGMLEKGNQDVRETAGEVLRALTGEVIGTKRPELWKAWWKDHGEEALKRRHYPYPDLAADQEAKAWELSRQLNDEKTRDQARAELAKMGPGVIPMVKRQLDGEPKRQGTREAAIEIIAGMGRVGVEELARQCASANLQIMSSQQAWKRLADLDPKGPGEMLLHWLEVGDFSDQRQVIEGLGTYGYREQAGRIRELILDRRREHRDRVALVGVLVKLEGGGGDSVGFVTKLAMDEKESVGFRQDMVAVLIPLKAESVPEALEKVLSGAESYSVVSMAEMLGRKGPEQVCPILERLRDGDRPEAFRARLASALVRLKRPGAMEKLLPFLKSSNVEARAVGLQALGEGGGEEALDLLCDIAGKDASGDCRKLAAKALGRTGKKEAIPVLMKLAADPERGVVQEAVWALDRLTGKGFGQNTMGPGGLDKAAESYKTWWAQQQPTPKAKEERKEESPAAKTRAGEIHDAAKAGDLERVKKIVQADREQVNATGEKLPTPLHVAAWWGQKAVAEFLIAKGADVNAKDKAELLSAENRYSDMGQRAGATPLHLATYRGNAEMMELLIAKGAKVDAGDDGGWTALAWAARWTRKSAAELLIAKGADVNARDNKGLTALHHAEEAMFSREKRAVVELLVGKGADVNATGKAGETPVSVATAQGWEDEVKFLVQHGAKGQSSAGQLHDAARAGDVEKVKAVLDAAPKAIDAEYMGWKSALVRAANAGKREAAQLLIARGADVNLGCPLAHAARQGHKEIVEMLLAKGAGLEGRDELKRTPLGAAAYAGRKEVVQLLVEKGSDMKATDSEGCTPVHLAVRKGSLETVALLIEKGADVHARSTYGYTMVGDAAGLGYTDVLKLLLEKGAEFDVVVEYQGTPMHQAADRGHTGALRVLIAKGADVNGGKAEGMRPLQKAAAGGHVEAVQALLEGGADVNAQTAPRFDKGVRVSQPDDEKTALCYAARGGHAKVAEALLAKGADANAGDALLEAVKGNHKVVAELLLTKGATATRECLKAAAEQANKEAAKLVLAQAGTEEAKKALGSSALHRAAARGDKEAVEALLARGADVNAPDQEAELDHQPTTALHWAAAGGHVAVAEVLIAKGANVNVGKGTGSTPLHMAARRGNKEMVELLIRKGADVYAKDRNGATALNWVKSRDPRDRAKDRDYEGVVAALEKRMQEVKPPAVEEKKDWKEEFLAARKSAAQKAAKPFGKDVPSELLCWYGEAKHVRLIGSIIPMTGMACTSSDGKKVACVTNKGLLMLNLADGSVRRVCGEKDWVLATAFSGDGKRLAVAVVPAPDEQAQKEGKAEVEVAVVEVATGKKQTARRSACTLAEDMVTSLAWVDDKSLAVYELKKGEGRVVVTAVEGGEEKVLFDGTESEKKWPRREEMERVLPGEDWSPLWEPLSVTKEGKVYFCWKGRLFRADAKTAKAELVCGMATEGGLRNAKASPAGGRVMVSACEEAKVGTGMFDEELREGKGLGWMQVTDYAGSENFANWFADGKHAAALSEWGDLVLTDASGTKQVRVAKERETICGAVWPLGTKDVLVLTENGLWRCEVGKELRKLDGMRVAERKYPDYSTPERTLETWEEAQIRGDRKTMFDCLSPEFRPKVESGWTEIEKKDAAEFEDGLRMMRGRIVINRLFHPTETQRAEIKGEHATVYRDEQPEAELVKIGNEWKISAFMNGPAAPEEEKAH